MIDSVFSQHSRYCSIPDSISGTANDYRDRIFTGWHVPALPDGPIKKVPGKSKPLSGYPDFLSLWFFHLNDSSLLHGNPAVLIVAELYNNRIIGHINDDTIKTA